MGSNALKLNAENLKKLLLFNDEVEFEQQSTGFKFVDFCKAHEKDKFNPTSALTFLKNRKAIYSLCKASTFNYGVYEIKKGDKATDTDFTFKRLDAFLRVKLLTHCTKIWDGTDPNAQTALCSELAKIPIVKAYGLEVSDKQKCYIAIVLGGNLSLLASLPGCEVACFALAIFQDLKKNELGIKSDFDTKDQAGRVAAVLDAKNFVFGEPENEKLKKIAGILKEMTPTRRGHAALTKYAEQLSIISGVIGVTFEMPGTSKAKESKNHGFMS
ncbi:nucleocapsid protein [Bean necrotic mosaic virus]|uniref:Nucleoprotein n=1 Tax=Bean necrotic mosaic virus TaxID=1033976 RepID=I3PCS9_9VIRU|nr:nucleocapsid protein [Bean necrotic mosaic virus]AER23986.1 nucleocapsid protein [Bean necrotic mosaic virus]